MDFAALTYNLLLQNSLITGLVQKTELLMLKVFKKFEIEIEKRLCTQIPCCSKQFIKQKRIHRKTIK